MEVNGGVDKSLSVALIKKSLDIYDGVVEAEHLLELGKLHVLIEVLAFLKDPNGEDLCNEWLVLLEAVGEVIKSLLSFL